MTRDQLDLIEDHVFTTRCWCRDCVPLDEIKATIQRLIDELKKYLPRA